MKKENVELIEDEEIITLYDSENKPVEFYEIACVELDDKYFALVQPVHPMEGLGEDEALIFELKEQEDETDLFVPVESEEVLERVFDEYMKAVADCECGHEHCGCGECDCGDGCDCDGEADCGCGECDCEKK